MEDAGMEIRAYTEYNEAEILGLYASVGWTAYTDDPAALRNGFANSLLTLAAYEEAALAGLIRVVGDGHTIVFVQDILVRPQFQRRGIGSVLLQAVLNRYAGVRQIELLTDDTPETAAFYRSMGFRELTELGCRGFMKI
jgi:GNAT superfamily N-acetyltransferase